MAVSDFQFFILPLLSELADGKVNKLQGLDVLLAQKENLSEEDKYELLPIGKQRVFHNSIGWARTYLKKAGLQDVVKFFLGSITEDSKTLLKSNPTQINKSTLAQYALFHDWQNGASDLSVSPALNTIPLAGGDPDTSMSHIEQMEASFTIIKSELSDEILILMRDSSPRFFETLVVDLMSAMGYGGWSKDLGKSKQYSADAGIDGVINEVPLGLDTIYLQAKRYRESNTVGRPDIRAFSGALDMQRARKGVFITTSKFSSDGLDYVQCIEKNCTY